MMQASFVFLGLEACFLGGFVEEAGEVGKVTSPLGPVMSPLSS